MDRRKSVLIFTALFLAAGLAGCDQLRGHKLVLKFRHTEQQMGLPYYPNAKAGPSREPSGFPGLSTAQTLVESLVTTDSYETVVAFYTGRLGQPVTMPSDLSSLLSGGAGSSGAPPIPGMSPAPGAGQEGAKVGRSAMWMVNGGPSDRADIISQSVHVTEAPAAKEVTILLHTIRSGRLGR